MDVHAHGCKNAKEKWNNNTRKRIKIGRPYYECATLLLYEYGAKGESSLTRRV